MREWCFQIYLYESEELVFEDDERWALYDPDEHQEFFPDGYRAMSANDSENEQYTVCWSEQSRERDDLVVPAGFCIVENGSVSNTVELEGVSKAEIANDGTVALLQGPNQFSVFDSEGEELYRESFESNIMMANISPDGEYAALCTAAPDNAVHMFEPQNGQYLGRVENTGRSIIQYLDFTSEDGEDILRTYNSTPNIREDVHPNRRTPMDEIPVESQFDVTSMGGIGVISESNDDVWHHVPEDEVQEVEGRLRIPGVALQSSCNKEIIPIESHLIYSDIEEAVEEPVDFCEQCRESAAVYPDEKVERSFDDRLDR